MKTAWGLVLAGGALGVVAGLVQALAGDVIPEWTGDKNDTVQLGLATIGLSLVAVACFWRLSRGAAGLWLRALLAAAFLAAVIVCFTTVGRLWYVPGPLMLVAFVLHVSASRRVAGG